MPTAESSAAFSPLAAVVRRLPSAHAAPPALSPLVLAPFVPLGMPPSPAVPLESLPEPAAAYAIAVDCDEPAEATVEEAVPTDARELGANVRLFGARIADALDAAIPILIERLAADVLGRELEVAPAAVAAIAQRLAAAYLAEGPIAVRISQADRGFVHLDGIPVVVDPALRAGDCIVDVASGAYDASLGLRLAAVIGAACTH